MPRKLGLHAIFVRQKHWAGRCKVQRMRSAADFYIACNGAEGPNLRVEDCAVVATKRMPRHG